MLSAGGGLVARATSVGANLVVLPMAVNHLGPEQFGVWATLASMSTFLLFADLGLGNGIMNSVAESIGAGDEIRVAGVVSSGFFGLTIISGVLFLALLVAYPLVNWASLLKIGSSAGADDAGLAVLAYAGLTIAAIPFSVAQRLQMGRQEAWVASLWQAAGALLSVAFVAVAISAKARLPGMVVAMAGAPVVAGVVNGLFEFTVRSRTLRPRWSLVTSLEARGLLRLGLAFFVLQLLGLVAYSFDNVILLRTLGPIGVTNVAVPVRLVGVAIGLVSLVLAPLWPAFGEAHARGDASWIRQALGRATLGAGIGGGLVTGVAVLAAPWLLAVFFKGNVVADRALILPLAAFALANAVTQPAGMYLLGTNQLRFSLLTMSLMAPIAVIAKVVGASQWGAIGYAWANVATFAAIIAIPTLIYVRALTSPEANGVGAQ